MAIIVSTNETVQNNFIMSNDGMGFEILIPTIYIG